jgi:hypothetical protein
VFATYNDRNKKRFVYDLLGSQLLWFFISNFSDTYLSSMNLGFRERVEKMFDTLKHLYSN